ncbi:MAG: AI-2E family transporter [Elusimicrobia bacterium]|nr:AI-2E family transporter [Elusimicrobiota bacterium]
MSLSRLLAYCFPLGSAALAAALLWAARPVLMPFLLALAFAYLADPAVRSFQSLGLRRAPSVGLVHLILIAAVVAGASFAVKRLRAETARIESGTSAPWEELDSSDAGQLENAARLSPVAEKFDDLLAAAEPWVLEANEWTLGVDMEGWRSKAAAGAASGLGVGVSEFGALLIRALSWLLLIPFASYFILLAGPGALDSLLRLASGRHIEKTLHVLWSLDESVGRYCRGILLESLGIGLLTYAGLRALGVDFALWLSLLSGAANVIPVAGPAAAAAAALLVSFGGVLQPGAGTVLGLFAALRAVDHWALKPALMHGAGELHPLAVLFSVCCGAALGGPAGLLLAVPAACVLRVFLVSGWEWTRDELGLKAPPGDLRAERALV